MTVHNPYDKLFKLTYGDLDRARQALSVILPQELCEGIDLTRLEERSESFVSSEMRAYFADLLFRAPMLDEREAYIYLLLEHKSTYDSRAPFQLLKYMMEIWVKHQREHPTAPLPVIVPILFIQDGPSDSPFALNFQSLFGELDSDSPSKRFIPSLELIVQPLADTKYREKLDRATEMMTSLLVISKNLQNIRDNPEFAEVLAKIYNTSQLAGGAELVTIAFQFIYSVVDKDTRTEVTKMSEKLYGFHPLPGSIGDAIMQEGREEGREEGRSELLKVAEYFLSAESVAELRAIEDLEELRVRVTEALDRRGLNGNPT